MPWFVILFGLAGLASLGLPGLSGFVAEFHIFVGTIPVFPFFAAIGILSAAITATYILRLLGRMALGPFNERWVDLREISRWELVAGLTLLCRSWRWASGPTPSWTASPSPCWNCPVWKRSVARWRTCRWWEAEMDLEYELIVPELALAGFAVVIGAGALTFRQVKQEVWGYLSALGLLVLLVLTAVFYINVNDDFANVLAVDNFTTSSVSSSSPSRSSRPSSGIQYAGDRLRNHGEFYALILLATLGMMDVGRLA